MIQQLPKKLTVTGRNDSNKQLNIVIEENISINSGAPNSARIRKQFTSQQTYGIHLGESPQIAPISQQAITPGLRRDSKNKQLSQTAGKMSAGCNQYCPSPKKIPITFINKNSLGSARGGPNHLLPQPTLLSEKESHSDNDNKFSTRLHNQEAQSKNIRHFQNVLKEQKKEKKERKLRQKQKDYKKKEEKRKRLKYRGSDTSNRTLDGGTISGGTFGGGLKRFKVISKRLTNMTSDIRKTTQSDDENEETNEDDFKRIERQFERSRYALFPDSNFKTIWDFGSFILIVYFALFLPFQISFQQNVKQTNSFFLIIDVVSQIWFLLDICINFNTGFQDKGVLIMSRKKIMINYLKSWFSFDMVASFPYDWILDPYQAGDNNEVIQNISSRLSWMRAFRYLRIIRLLRVIKVEALLVHVEDHIVSDMTNALLRFSKLMIVTFFFAHWMACLFFAVAFRAQSAYGESWISQTNVLDASVAEQYINALYWCITTMATVGYGDIKPQTTQERAVCIFIMLIAAGVYAYILNDVGHIVTNYNILAAQYKEKMLYVNQFLTTKGIPKDLRDRIHRYLDYNWELKKSIKIDEDELMELLNNDLRNQIKSHLTGRILLNVEFFEKNFEVDFMSQITHIFHQKSYAVDDNIIYEDQMGDEIFFIIQGRVAIIHKKSHTYIKDLSKDDYFGEISFFGDVPRICSGKSRDFTDVYSITKYDFLELTGGFPSAINMYNKIKDSIYRGQKDYKLLKLRCYVCGKKKDHVSLDCTNFRQIAGNLKARYDKIADSKKKKLKLAEGDGEQQESGQFSPVFYKNNLLVPRHSFIVGRGMAEQRMSIFQNFGQDSMLQLIAQLPQMEQQENLKESTFTEDDLDDNNTSQHSEKVQSRIVSKKNSGFSEQNNLLALRQVGLEDIQEDTSLENSDHHTEDKGLYQRGKTNQYQMGHDSTKTRSDSRILFKRATTELAPSEAKINGVTDIQVSPFVNNKVHEHYQSNAIREVSDSSCMKTEFEESSQNQKKEDVTEQAKFQFQQQQQQLKQKNIQPLRGIRKNTLIRKFRMKTGKVFTEDLVEDLLKSNNDDDMSPKQVHKKREGQENSTQDLIGIHTMISSRDSQDWSKLIHQNSQALLLKITNSKRRLTNFHILNQVKGLSCSATSNNKNLEAKSQNNDSNPIITKQSSSIAYQKEIDEPQSFSQFQKIKNLNFAVNKGNAQTSLRKGSKINSHSSPSDFSDQIKGSKNNARKQSEIKK